MIDAMKGRWIMKSKMKIALLGGDLRQYVAAVGLARKGWNICLWGMENAVVSDPRITISKDLQQALDGCMSVVLPLPTTTDGVTLNCPLGTLHQPIHLMDLMDMIVPGTLVIGGRLPSVFQKESTERGIRCIDYDSFESFQMENAYLTAEAAVGIAMNHLNAALRDASFAITGFGRIGKHLAALLKKFGAEVTVAARKSSDLALAQSFGCKTVSLQGSEDKQVLALRNGFDVIYNTVPCWLFGRTFLEQADPHIFLIDLASAPGGVDICAAKEFGTNVLWATSLPGKYAPRSAGNLICSCVDEILQKEVAIV